ncbi:3-phosphoshikimate 1-carboxyvinyltransferase [Bacteroidota bacterium]
MHLFYSNVLKATTITPPASKSISNRLLIMNALSDIPAKIHNLSDARDTRTMQQLLNSGKKVLNVLDAGTTIRFLTAYYSTRNENRVLTGTPRMCERPIGILVDALRVIGVEIDFIQEKGYPPIEIKNFVKQLQNQVSMRGDVSSQYISAMLMIAPVLSEGLILELTGKISSLPYIKMTLGLMTDFGIHYTWEEDKNIIEVPNQAYKPVECQVESDWSGASYWYSTVALAESGDIFLEGLTDDSYQGDRQISEIMKLLGVSSTFEGNGVLLSKIESVDSIQYNFSECPDLAQTVMVVCAAKGIHGLFTGLESLRIKETDRIIALQQELDKIGASLTEKDPDIWELIPGKLIPEDPVLEIATYDDHRMAMAFAPLACKTDLIVENPDVVDKSYPGFWEDLRKVGFRMKKED